MYGEPRRKIVSISVQVWTRNLLDKVKWSRGENGQLLISVSARDPEDGQVLRICSELGGSAAASQGSQVSSINDA
jgi:hypothetical protein